MSEVTTDHDTIRRWAEAKGGKPAAVGRTHKGGDVGIIRIMFPDAPQSEHEALAEISWEEFFQEFEKRKLALIYERDSLFSKIVGRESAEQREHGVTHASRYQGDGRGKHAEQTKHGKHTGHGTHRGEHHSTRH